MVVIRVIVLLGIAVHVDPCIFGPLVPSVSASQVATPSDFVWATQPSWPKRRGPDGPGRSWTVLAATEPADFSGFTLCLKPERKVSMEVRSGKTNENVMCKFEDINESTV